MEVKINKLPLAFIKGDIDDLTHKFYIILILLAIASISLSFAFGFAYTIKSVLIFLVAVIVARETEILFLTHRHSILRTEAKEMIKITKPEITGLIIAFLVPVGTPLFVVLIGTFVAIFIGKMVFGGYSYNIFNPALVGFVFIFIAWPALLTTGFVTSLENNLIEVLIGVDLSTALMTPLDHFAQVGFISYSNTMPTITQLLFTVQAGNLASVPVIVYFLVMLYAGFMKIIDLKVTFAILCSAFLVALLVGLNYDQSINYALFHVLSGSLIFVAIFMATDPFTSAYSTVGKIVIGVIVGSLVILIRMLGDYPDSAMFALLFANLFIPFINKKTVSLKLNLDNKVLKSKLILLSIFIISIVIFKYVVEFNIYTMVLLSLIVSLIVFKIITGFKKEFSSAVLTVFMTLAIIVMSTVWFVNASIDQSMISNIYEVGEFYE